MKVLQSSPSLQPSKGVVSTLERLSKSLSQKLISTLTILIDIQSAKHRNFSSDASFAGDVTSGIDGMPAVLLASASISANEGTGMTVYGSEVLRDLLLRIANGQINALGEDVPVFESLKAMNLVFHNGEGGPEGYYGVCTTPEGDYHLANDPAYPPAN